MPIIVLRHIKNGTFFRAKDDWTQEPALAHNFVFLENAQQYALTNGLDQVDAVCMTPDLTITNGTRLDVDI
jgi:hypothetical protein